MTSSMKSAVLLVLTACAVDVPATGTVSRPIIDVASEMCVALTGLEAIDGVCDGAELSCTPRRCCLDDWSYCCVWVDGVLVCG